MTKPPPLTIGGKYRVIRRLGQGGMGAVYEAEDDQGARVAVKVIMTELAGNQTLVGRFAREARAAAAIDTPHIAKAIDAGTDPITGQAFLVMELLDGEDIDQLQKRVGPLPAELALRISAQACRALQKAHEARVLHRDIKPANLFLARRPEGGGGRIIKLLDFGVAKVKPEVTRSNAETAGLTRTGSMLGSPLYMSPEQARGYKDIDFRSDLWSIGVVLYKMLSGRAPHDDTEELGELIVLICTEPPEPIQDLAPWVPPEIASVVHRALRFSPAERYASAAEMLAALEALLPRGSDIDDSMVRSLTDAEKAYVAPRLQADLTDAPPPRKTGQTTGTGMTRLPAVPAPAPSGQQMVSPPATGPAPISTLEGGAVGSTVPPTHSPLAGMTPAAGPQKSAAPWIAVAAVAALAVAGGVLFQFTGIFRGNGAAAVPATQTAAAPEGKPRSVTVVILPPDAKVDVDGTPAALSEGLLEITGTIGSVHRVHVVSGDSQKSVRVVVSESGAIPPKIEVKEAEGPGATATATASAPVLSGPRPKPKPTSAPTAAPSDDLRNKR
jgi:serine/threonine-protein kinase